MFSLLAEKTQSHHLKSFLLTDLEDRNSFSDHCCEGDGSFRANQAVAKVDHLQAPQVCQSLRRQQRMHEYRKHQSSYVLPSRSCINRIYLCHSQRSLFGKSVVIEVQDTELTIVSHS